MRIAHVVNLVDGEASYGGPLRVAVNQVDELNRRGHQAVLVAGADSAARRDPARVLGATSRRLFRSLDLAGGRSFAYHWTPGLHAWLLTHGRSFDVCHVHLARDLTTAPAAQLLRLLRVPYVVQTHGMVVPSPRRSAWAFDRLLVRGAMRRAATGFVLTGEELDGVRALGFGDLPVEILPNGVPTADLPAEGADGPPEVLYLARLHECKRPVRFVEAAQLLLARGVDADFTLLGPDEGELPAVTAAIARRPELTRVSYGGVAPMAGSLARIARASVFVLPSARDAFPMVVVEAMSVGVPVVVTEACGLAPMIAEAGAGTIVPADDPAALAAAVEGLLADPALARKSGENGRALVDRSLSIEAVGRRLEESYLAAIPAGRGRVPAP
ncbi:MAG: glycosyltransferase [Actinomycetales bacterium]|nr:glycosyltransferase [Actinomycetales bacterium]